jgi:cystathionine beta-lyase/cystathionine gamma-synthase/pimeloyl-ACP methyl ester carboxylesterase
MSIWHSGELSIGYDDTGSGGPPVLLVHGHPFNRSMWYPQVSFLADRGFRVIAPDLRGYGDSSVLTGRCPLEVFARDIAALLDHLDLPAAVMCGLSMGGQIVLEFSRLFPDRVLALVLAGTSAPPDTETAAASRRATADRLLAEGMAGYAAEVLPKMISPETISGRPDVAAHVSGMMRGTAPAGAAAALRGRAERPDYVPMLAGLTVPALVLVGSEDEFTPLTDAELIASRLADATLVVIPGAAHLPNLERPAAFNRALGQFLDAAMPGPAGAGDRLAQADSGLVHAGTGRELGDPVVPPPVLSSIFASAGEPGTGPAYARSDNPTWTALERALGALEAADAVVFSSGQAAAMALMLALARGRDRILLPRDGYYNARELAARLRPHGAEAVLVDLLDLAEVESELRRGTAVLWAESPTNPLLRVADLAALGRLAASAGAPMVVDNTVATGLLQQPLELGAVASLCSLTKSASGHSDLIMGAVLTRDLDLLADLRGWRTTGGGIAGPVEAWLALRGLKTLPLRIERQSATALAIAEYLTAHPGVTAVHYPGTSAPTVALARTQMARGFGPLLSFELDGAAADADRVVAAARLIVPATSFGGVESTWERRGRWPGESAPASLIRLSAGLEPAADLIADIEQSLRAG